MGTPVLVDIARTAVGRGKAAGELSSVHPTDLLAGVIQALVARSGIDPARIEDIIADAHCIEAL